MGADVAPARQPAAPGSATTGTFYPTLGLSGVIDEGLVLACRWRPRAGPTCLPGLFARGRARPLAESGGSTPFVPAARGSPSAFRWPSTLAAWADTLTSRSVSSDKRQPSNKLQLPLAPDAADQSARKSCALLLPAPLNSQTTTPSDLSIRRPAVFRHQVSP